MNHHLKAKHANQANPCSRVLGDIAKTCFLITAETKFDAHMNWAAHVNELTVHVAPKGSSQVDHAVLEFDEYINLPKTTGFGSDDWRTDTYPAVKKFAGELTAFYERAIADVT